MKKIEIFTDGACSGNPGLGGWGVLLRYGSNEKELSGGETLTTNNRMELTAVIKALESLKEPCEISLCSDSKYVIEGVNKWMPNWKKNGWKTASRKAVANVDLWERLDSLLQKHNVSWQWVKGHEGHPENERVDALARSFIEKTKQI